MGLMARIGDRGAMRLSGGPMRRLRGHRLQSLKQVQGFTLIELMLTISVAAVLLTVGVPSFQEFIASNRLTSEVNGLSAFIQLARSEAIKSGRRVTLCASSDGTSCATTGYWEQGYLFVQGYQRRWQGGYRRNDSACQFADARRDHAPRRGCGCCPIHHVHAIGPGHFIFGHVPPAGSLR